MKRFRTLTVLTSVAAMVFVASALAQDALPFPRAGAGNVFYTPAGSGPQYTPDSGPNFYFTTAVHPGGGDNPAVRKLGVEEATLSQKASALSKELTSTDSDSKRSEIKSKLTEVLGKQFDTRQQRHKLEIENLEGQVKKLKDLVRRRQESRDEIINRRLDQVVRDSEGLGW